MNEPTVRGTVHEVGETKTFGQRGFRKRVVALEQPDGHFTNYIPVELVQDNCELADDLKVGDEVEVAYRLKGRKWQPDTNSEPKYFSSVEVVSLTNLSSGAGSTDLGSGPGSEDDPGPSDPGPAGFDDEEVPF